MDEGKILQLVESSRNTGKVKVGTNETTKAVERGIAKLVVIAENVEPKEVVMHLPVLCKEKKIPFCYVKDKNELGRSAGIGVATASLAIIESDKKALDEIVKEISMSRE